MPGRLRVLDRGYADFPKHHSCRHSGEQGPGARGSSETHRRFIAVCFLGLTMKVLLEGLFVVAVLLLELVGMIILARHMLTTETYPLASRNAVPTASIVTSEDDYDGGDYWA